MQTAGSGRARPTAKREVTSYTAEKREPGPPAGADPASRHPRTTGHGAACPSRRVVRELCSWSRTGSGQEWTGAGLRRGTGLRDEATPSSGSLEPLLRSVTVCGGVRPRAQGHEEDEP